MIEAKNLTMHYGLTRAVDDVSFKVGEKEIVGFLGPNGAGKTTLMRMLTTFIHPTRGSAFINGVDILENPVAARRHLGYLPETPPLYADMRVDEFLAFIGSARGLNGRSFQSRKDWVVAACALAPVWKHTIFELSLGYRQRVGLAQALLHDPKVVILDEPTSGLDPIQIISIRKLIQELAKTKTILFSTHILQEASAVSDRILIINKGKLMVQGTVSELRASAVKNEEVFKVTLEAPKSDVAAALTSLKTVKRAVYIEEYQNSPRFLVAFSSYREAIVSLNDLCVTQGWKIKELVREEPSLEEVFLDLFKKC
jgi:ABC-2 type transport system ATP-binding protein